MVAGNRVLIVDDEADVREMLGEYLGGHGFQVSLAESGEAMRTLIAEAVPDLVLLDVGLPGEDGVTLARYLRERFTLGIIMVTGADSVIDRVVGLEVGADDYVTKPFDPRELLARVRSVLRRLQPGEPTDSTATSTSGPVRGIRFGTFTLDLDSHELRNDSGEEIPLTRMEYELLKVLAERPGRVLSRDSLLQLTQNRDWDPFDRSVDIRIARLRRKLETNPERPQIIRTVRGIGYRFVPGN